MCEACTDPGATPEHTTGGDWTGSTCCGDDIGEGGFVYGDLTLGTDSAVSVYGVPAGDYNPSEEGYCADFVDANDNGEFDEGEQEINNDCDGDTRVNCGDFDCRGTGEEYESWREDGFDIWRDHLGPRGSICCSATAATYCKNFLDPSSTAPGGTECTENNECNCTAVGIDAIRSDVSAGDVVRTCVPSSGELFGAQGDRKFEVADGDHTFELYAYDVDGGDEECGEEAVTMIVDENDENPIQPGNSASGSSFYFMNIASVDCLVEVRISEE